MPLNVKKVPECFIDELIKLAASTPFADQFARLIPILREETYYVDIELGPDVIAGTRTGIQRCINAMLDAKVCRTTVPGERIIRTGKVFEVVEEKEGALRLRIIFWPFQLNDEFWAAFTSGIELKPIFEQMAEVHAGDWAACFDLKCAFLQFPLAPGVQPRYGFVGPDGTEYVMTRMVMGGVPSAEICDVALKILAHTSAAVNVTTHIDNVRFTGDRSAVAAAAAEFRDRCRRCNVTLNDEPENEPHQRGKFLGVEYDYGAKTVCLAEKTRLKLRAWLGRLDALTFGDVASLFGNLMWASTVTSFPLQTVYYSIKYFRRRLSHLQRFQSDHDSPTTVWPCVRVQLEAWMQALIDSGPQTPNGYCALDAEVSVFTDASTSGWGGFLLDHRTGEIKSCGGKWCIPGRHINQLELEAVRQVTERFRNYLVGAAVRLYIDNTSALATIQRGRSNSYWLNQQLLTLAPIVHEFKSLRVDYVASADNLADAPSRGRAAEWTTQQLPSPAGGGVFVRDARPSARRSCPS